MNLSELKTAIVYDWIDKWGGVERLLAALHEMFPRAPFFTSYFNQQNAAWARGFDIRTSFIQSFPARVRGSRTMSFFFYPYAFESFDFSGYDLVISVSSSFGKSVITMPGTAHLSILLTPTRYLWLYPERYLGPVSRTLLGPYLSHMKRWDTCAARRPDRILSISEAVRKRARTHYGIETGLLYPPFDMRYWERIEKEAGNGRADVGGYFLTVSRLEPYKRVDLVVDAFRRMPDRRLIVVGSGSLLSALKRRAGGGNITFLQGVSDTRLAQLYMHARALIMPQEEDFGYTAIEAQFFGCPVIAYARGGAGETVADGETGIFFDAQDNGAIRRTLERYDKISYNLKHAARRNGKSVIRRFSKERFQGILEDEITNSVNRQNTRL